MLGSKEKRIIVYKAVIFAQYQLPENKELEFSPVSVEELCPRWEHWTSSDGEMVMLLGHM